MDSPSSPSGNYRVSSFTLGSLLQRRARSNTNGSLISPPESPHSPADAERTSYFPSIRRGNGNYVALSRRATEGDSARMRSTSLSAVSPIQQDIPEQPDPPAEASSGPHVTVRLVPHLELISRSLHFEPILRHIKPGSTLRIGRFNERAPQTPQAGSIIPGGPIDVTCPRTAFKSKVVSRSHAEITLDTQSGVFSVRDTKSSSGTFLNHVRLSGPGLESRWHVLRNGDILQLGVDYQGGTEEMYRCVKIKVEIDRKKSSKSTSQFNAKTLSHIRSLQQPVKASSSDSTDCCICLFAVTACQSLFIAPCSHVYHYKCIRPLLLMHHPGFSCPMCRTFADLDADVDEEHGDLPIAEEDEDDSPSDQEGRTSAEEGDIQPTGALTATAPLEASRSDRRSPHSRRSSAASRRSRPSNLVPPLPSAGSDQVPDAGEYQAETRRASIQVSGPNGPMGLSITGRNSRPASVFNMELTTPERERQRGLSQMHSIDDLADYSMGGDRSSETPTATMTAFPAAVRSPPLPTAALPDQDMSNSSLSTTPSALSHPSNR